MVKFDGPSPRARGKPSAGSGKKITERTIPTDAGKTNFRFFVKSHAVDHPHGRGENGTEHPSIAAVAGPSPRARGKQTEPVSGKPNNRTIPTGAGKTKDGSADADLRTDHPHARGENKDSARLCPERYGPSPRARGKLTVRTERCFPFRTIPTGAGKTTDTPRLATFKSDHPHGRGENYDFMSESSISSGPSPRARGKRGCKYEGLQDSRTIPTGAGKTPPPPPPKLDFSDHPHGRGENSIL